MRTRLFHSIVVCGAALGVAVGCSGDGDEGDAKKHGANGCPPYVVPATDETGGSSTTLAPSDDGVAGSGDGTAGANDGALDAGSTGGCGGWPPTK